MLLLNLSWNMYKHSTQNIKHINIRTSKVLERKRFSKCCITFREDLDLGKFIKEEEVKKSSKNKVIYIHIEISISSHE